MTRWGDGPAPVSGTLLAEFASAEPAARALLALRARGVRHIETYAPFPLSNEDAHAPRGSFALAFFAFSAGLLGILASYGVQWYVNARSYPLNIGGRPAHAAPAFVPATFETTILFAAVAVFVGFLFLEGLPRLWQPVFEIDGFERASIDRFWIAVDLGLSTADVELVIRELTPMNPLRIVLSEDVT